MIIRELETTRGSDRNVVSKGWESARMLLKQDGMGFSFHITTIRAGAQLPMCYRHHLEAVYCLSGDGSVHDLATGEIHPVREGVLYALNKNDDHVLFANTEMQMACVFNPPLTGGEVHDETGAYPPDKGPG